MFMLRTIYRLPYFDHTASIDIEAFTAEMHENENNLQ